MKNTTWTCPACGHYYEWSGRDESSRQALKRTKLTHPAECPDRH